MSTMKQLPNGGIIHTGKVGKPVEGKGTAGIKHISQLDPAGRALADQSIRDALLAIVTAQGKPVTIPIADLNAISEQYRLKVEVDREAGKVTLTSEKAPSSIVEAKDLPESS